MRVGVAHQPGTTSTSPTHGGQVCRPVGIRWLAHEGFCCVVEQGAAVAGGDCGEDERTLGELFLQCARVEPGQVGRSGIQRSGKSSSARASSAAAWRPRASLTAVCALANPLAASTRTTTGVDRAMSCAALASSTPSTTRNSNSTCA